MQRPPHRASRASRDRRARRGRSRCDGPRPRASRRRAAQRASSGISVSACTSEISTAAASVIDSARKNWPTTPDSMPSGTKTTTVVSVEPTTGATSSRIASWTDCAGRLAAVEMPVDVLDDDDRIVDDEADRDREPAHRHHVDRLAEPAHHEERRHDGERQRDGCDERQAPVAQEHQQHDRPRARRRRGWRRGRWRSRWRRTPPGRRSSRCVRPAGSACARSCSADSTPARTSRMLAPICCETLMFAATRPVAADERGAIGRARWTVATSETRIVAPPLTTIGVARMSSIVFHRPDASDEVLQPAGGVAARPAAAGSTPAARRRRRRSSGRRRQPARDRRSPRSPACRSASTSTLPTPGTRDSAGRIT